MVGVAGYVASVKKSGTSTSFTGEATTNTSGNTYQINDTAKRVWDRDTLPTFYDNAVEIDAADVLSIDYLFGKVTFTGSKTGPITVDGDYMPMATVAGAKEVTLTLTSAVLDDTDFGNSGYHTKDLGLHDVTISLGRFGDVNRVFPLLIAARTPIVIEVAPSSSEIYRGWFLPESADGSLDINALYEETVSFQLDGDDETGKTYSES